MNKQPDETTITLWIDGELEGEALQRMEAWAHDHPELLAERDAIQAMNTSIRESVPASVEPPYADFFNQRIMRQIEDEKNAEASDSGRKRSRIWQWLSVPAAAVAMMFCFYLGTRVAEPMSVTAPVSANVSSVYTPDGDVRANVFRAEQAGATVIVLEGLKDIPDNMEMVGQPYERSDGAVMVHAQETY